jgi:hypothetical protein
MAFTRSPVRSRSGPPSFAHDCRRRMPRRSVAVRHGGGAVASERASARQAIRHPSFCSAVIPRDRREHRGSCTPSLPLRSQRLLSFGSVRVVSAGSVFQPGDTDVAFADMPEDKRLAYVLKSATPRPRYCIGLMSMSPPPRRPQCGPLPLHRALRSWQLHVTIELPDDLRLKLKASISPRDTSQTSGFVADDES